MSHTLHKPATARLTALVAALALAFVAVLATATPAAAHDALVGTDPATGSTVAELPPQVTLTFSDAVAPDDGATVVEVKDAAGTELADGAPVVQDNTVTQALAGEASGVITVTWKVVSSDGHPTSNTFSFTVEGAAPTPTESATTAPTPTESAEPAPTAAPSETAAPPADEDSTFGDVWPWVVIGILLAAAGGAIVYVLMSRARRGDEDARDAAGQGRAANPGPGSDSPADH
ncbi:copper resistance protein CopC [Microbacterium sp. NEAU-LLC]|uniref:Copper resistance protein CopC n=1 Tax=Microbacterium helvum TaxID=2773713 RepID=A0ABR8NJ36_9MICO|nr:copper resistance CopC family protein [Microbacterium helvum]MBD3940700.1 copper resistance protein CopC [Microbacterium helvum]